MDKRFGRSLRVFRVPQRPTARPRYVREDGIAFSPRRQRRREIERTEGITTGRQWVRFRRAHHLTTTEARS